ncbi:MAG: hypothetical protein L0387_00375 [Acidobacteria bacterium]|nr:hypothetical protein [Acidobacteriota bacterium]MCI0718700.1 hypothetical protein [Acidobacteriota bacterium]
MFFAQILLISLTLLSQSSTRPSILDFLGSRGEAAPGGNRHDRHEKGVEEILEGLDYESAAFPKKAGQHTPAQTEQSHEEWLARRIQEVQEVKVGMSRAVLLKNFREEGGLQAIPARRYVLRSCAYIKIDVEFPIADKRPLPRDTQMKILRISKPYLELPIGD